MIAASVAVCLVVWTLCYRFKHGSISPVLLFASLPIAIIGAAAASFPIVADMSSQQALASNALAAAAAVGAVAIDKTFCCDPIIVLLHHRRERFSGPKSIDVTSRKQLFFMRFLRTGAFVFVALMLLQLYLFVFVVSSGSQN